ncbi:putative gtp-binding protein [Neofusicoccum parvum UCRNP2]|uniref:HR1 repeat rho-binding protein n=2 Tax=Neofusicoccum parvum TaxID=310453 RepID=A0ACB5S0K1_9PEZI|nr:putative gtp-binding protein [Neofusicoccum parvum UCRNP2]GME26345.1 HR1 repeat rho-binding protein [Neofusicoccum parvum]
MAPTRHEKQQLPQDRRKGESALSDFAEYVQKQQSRRGKPLAADSTAAAVAEEHDELDIIDQLGLDDESATAVRLKHILLDQGASADESVALLSNHLNARLLEGHGEALFDLGLEDNGDPMGFSKDDWDFALARLEQAAADVNADFRVLMTRNVGGDVDVGPANAKDTSVSGKLIVRHRPESVDDVIETRIAVVGNVDAGKSTMLGVLVKGGLDDGRGKMRVNLFRHKHEIESGRTSSVGMEIMGFDSKGEVVSSTVPGRKLSWEEIGRRSAKVISFTDLAGHEKYLRTTVFGMLSSEPNYCLLMVAANNGLVGMSKEHLGIAVALNVPIMVIITKIDICPPNILQETITQLTKILKSPGARKIPIFIKDRETCINTATQFVSRRICPIFQVSNVTGECVDLVRTFLNILPHHGNYDPEAPFEFHVNDTFSVPFVGTVVSGVVKSGVLHSGDTVLVGPDSLGQFITTKVYREFIAEVLILSHATTIKTKYQAMLHVGPVSQTCAIIDIDRSYIRTGDRATVAFRFVQRPEYLTVGERILFREGRTKGLGIVKAVGYDPKKPLNPEAAAEREKENGGTTK